MHALSPRIVGAESALTTALATGLAGIASPTLINADAVPDAGVIIARCRDFAAQARPAGLIITLLHAAPPGLAAWEAHAANATLWAFTRQAALDWAPRGLRINAIGRGAQATDEDVVRTVLAMVGWASMTGQIVRLGETFSPRPRPS